MPAFFVLAIFRLRPRVLMSSIGLLLISILSISAIILIATKYEIHNTIDEFAHARPPQGVLIEGSRSWVKDDP